MPDNLNDTVLSDAGLGRNEEGTALLRYHVIDGVRYVTVLHESKSARVPISADGLAIFLEDIARAAG